MEITLSNRITINKIPESLKQELVKELTVVNPKYIEAREAGRSTYGIDQYILTFNLVKNDCIVIPRGLRKWLIEKCTILGIKPEINDRRSLHPYNHVDSSNISYRSYQTKPVIDAVSKADEGLIIAAPGSGKTVIGLSLIPITGQPTLWLTHTGILFDQVIDRVGSFLPDLSNVNTISGGEWNVSKDNLLTIGMIQTVMRDLKKLRKLKDFFGLVLLDEAHHCPAETFLLVLQELNPYFMYGLTATPNRRDGLQQLMYQFIGTTQTVIPIGEIVEAGGIIKPKIKCISLRSDIVPGNNVDKIMKEHIIHNEIRNERIVRDVVAEAKAGKYCIVISDRREHCRVLYEMLVKRWPKTGIATGKYTKKQNRVQVKKLENKEITTLVATFSLLGEGFDVDFLDRGFIAMSFREENKAEQLIGRLQRTAEGKEDAIIRDYIDEDIGVLKSQFFSKNKRCRFKKYKELGVEIDY